MSKKNVKSPSELLREDMESMFKEHYKKALSKTIKKGLRDRKRKAKK